MLIKSGKKLTVTDSFTSFNKLEKGVYKMMFDDKMGFYLESASDFTLPKKLYGDFSIINRWRTAYNTFQNKNIGILLAGLKGTGKSLLAKKFCIEMEMPVIIIGSGYTGDDFYSFVTREEFDGCIFFIDEFEKLYDDEEGSNTLLSLLDGTSSMHNIFILTVNAEHLINENMLNRLSRIRYRIEFANLSETIIREVIDDLLIDKSHAASIFNVIRKLNIITYDILIELINEMNLFSESATSSANHLCLVSAVTSYRVEEVVKGSLHPAGNVSLDLQASWNSFYPSAKDNDAVYTEYIKDLRDSDLSKRFVLFKSDELVHIDMNTLSAIVDGREFILTRSLAQVNQTF